MPENTIRILLVDDHPAVRQGLALLLATASIQVVAEAGTLGEARARLAHQKPDVAVVDLSLEGEDGLALLAHLHQAGVPALVYSMHTDPQRVAAAFEAGARAYVAKRDHHDVLMDAIRHVAAGRPFLSPTASAALTERFTPAELSAQEREVFRHLGEGAKPAEIAAALNISVHTVESYFARLQVKLGLEGMSQLRRRAIRYLREHGA
jgi:DNA-binding NarL/FixJ family response regulator